MYKWFIIRMLIMLTVAQAAAAWPVNAHAQPAAPQEKQPISHVFTQRFVLIDAGHGGIDGGTVHHG
ncbi:MAG: hypothetical protein IKE34_14665, partial [Paenibacillus sp.]|nr:hypothetical protein [Paenibacillus sp.]